MAFGSTLETTFTGVGDTLKNGIFGVGETIKNGVLDVGGKIEKGLEDAGNVLKNSLVGMFTDFLGAFKRTQATVQDNTMTYLMLAAAGLGGFMLLKR